MAHFQGWFLFDSDMDINHIYLLFTIAKDFTKKDIIKKQAN